MKNEPDASQNQKDKSQKFREVRFELWNRHEVNLPTKTVVAYQNVAHQ